MALKKQDRVTELESRIKDLESEIVRQTGCDPSELENVGSKGVVNARMGAELRKRFAVEKKLEAAEHEVTSWRHAVNRLKVERDLWKSRFALMMLDVKGVFSDPWTPGRHMMDQVRERMEAIVGKGDHY